MVRRRTLAGAIVGLSIAHTAWAQDKKPNIVFIMGDDIGWFNIGAYHQGIMAGRTPNLDKLAAEGYAVHRLLRGGELHCGPGELHHRGTADPDRPDDRRAGRAPDWAYPTEAPTIATALKSMGYATGQFGKNHLGDLNQFLPDGPWIRRVFRLPVPPRRDGGPVPSQLPAGSQRHGRASQYGPFLGH